MNPRRLLRLMWLLLLASAPHPASAANVRAFDATSLATIRAEQAGHAFVLVFWSASCLPCVKELPAWGRRIGRHAGVPILLVNLDPAADQPAATAMAARKAGKGIQQWAMADDVPERVYWSVHPSWHGEAPFTLLHDAAHNVEKRYGRIGETEMSRWYSRK